MPVKKTNKVNIRTLAEFIDEKDRKEYPELKGDIEEGGMVAAYKKLYHPYSQVSHWSPDGVIRGKLNIGSALITAFQCLHMVSKCINDEYGFGFDDELNEILGRFLDQGLQLLP